MKKSKRLLAVLLALSMTATLAACSPGESDEPAQIHPSVEISRQMRKLFPPGKQAGPAHLSQAG